MRTLKLVIAYDGTDFVGWQRQPEGISVQGLIEDALALLGKGRVTIVGAGRTDAGVHATGQVASVQGFDSRLEPHDIRRALNAELPSTVRILTAEETSPTFHARFEARTKTYEYRIVNGPFASPFSCRYAWHVPARLDVGRMCEAARLIEGTHDFACFQSTGGGAATSVRTMFRSELTLANGLGRATFVPEPELPGSRLLVYRVIGDGFLRHMVRTIVGTLIEISAASWRPCWRRGRARRPDRRLLPADCVCRPYRTIRRKLRLDGKTL